MSKVIEPLVETIGKLFDSGVALPKPSTGGMLNSSLLKSGLERSALGALLRPTDAWFATVQERVKAAGLDIPIFDTYKAIDRGLQDATSVKDSLAASLGKLLPSEDHGYAYAEVLAHPEETWAHHASVLGLDSADLARLRGIKEWDATLQEKAGASLLDGLATIHQTRVNGLVPEGESLWHNALWGGAVSPEDLNLQRLGGFAINRSVMSKYTSGPIKEMEKLLALRGGDGEYLLGPIHPAVRNYLNMVQGIPDQSTALVNGALSLVAGGLNRVLPKAMQIDTESSGILQKYLTLTSSAAIGARPALFIRDLFENLKAMSVMGPTAFIRGIARAMTPEGMAASDVVALHGKNINEYLSSLNDTSLSGKWNDVAEAAMAPARWGNNIGRRAVYLGEVERASSLIAQYRAGEIDASALIQRSGLWFHDPVPRSRLLAMASSAQPVAQVADEFGRQMVDSTLYSLRYGNQPQLLRTSAGRMFGQFGQWPANYVDFGRKLAVRMREYPARGGLAMASFVGSQLAAGALAESVGVDISNWLFTAPAAYLPSPALEFVGNVAASPQDPSARRKLIEQALTFAVPGGVQIQNVLDAWADNDLSLARLAGFRELRPKEVESLDNWFLKQSGYPRGLKGTTVGKILGE